MLMKSPKKIRIFLDRPLKESSILDIENSDFHYLKNVMRIKIEDQILVFNGVDGEWICKIIRINRDLINLEVLQKQKEQLSYEPLRCYFTPLNNNRHNYIIEKLTELGITKFTPVITDYTNTKNLNIQKLYLRAKEAAEQSGLMIVPEITEQKLLSDLIIEEFNKEIILFCDEKKNTALPNDVLNGVKEKIVSFLIGPEGGFSDNERMNMIKLGNVKPVSLGSRILRADTAAIVAAAFLQITNSKAVI
jgi:16S rRNA (uracil1498-N3)-methyltransferase